MNDIKTAALMSPAQIAREYGVPQGTLNWRARNGWITPIFNDGVYRIYTREAVEEMIRLYPPRHRAARRDAHPQK